MAFETDGLLKGAARFWRKQFSNNHLKWIVWSLESLVAAQY
ncbi:conserved hypothetical protein [delta proteobacterium NaphS2]|nr:conserved hypothetical protein [delta proteobacterium NaphS2]